MAGQTNRSLLLDRDFILIWWTGLISGTGNLAMFVALPVTVYQQTDSALATAAAVLSVALPPVVFGQLAGVIADRSDRRRVLMWTNLALAGLTTPYLALSNGPWWALALASLVVGSVSQLVGPAEHALLGELVPARRLGEAASLNTLNNSLARLIGPAIGGLLFAHFGFRAVALLDAATFLAAATLVALVRSGCGRATTSPADGPLSVRKQWAEGTSEVWRHPRLRVLVALVAMVMLGEGFVSALLAPFTSEVLGGGAQTLGWMLSAQAIGGIVGAWWAARITDRHDPLRMLGSAAAVSGLLLFAIFNYAHVYPHVWPAIALTAVAGVPFAVYAAAQGTALQVYSPPHMRGRIFSLTWGIASLLQLCGIAAAGIAADAAGPEVINVDAATYFVCGVIALRLTHTLRAQAIK